MASKEPLSWRRHSCQFPARSIYGLALALRSARYGGLPGPAQLLELPDLDDPLGGLVDPSVLLQVGSPAQLLEPPDLDDPLGGLVDPSVLLQVGSPAQLLEPPDLDDPLGGLVDPLVLLQVGSPLWPCLREATTPRLPPLRAPPPSLASRQLLSDPALPMKVQGQLFPQGPMMWAVPRLLPSQASSPTTRPKGPVGTPEIGGTGLVEPVLVYPADSPHPVQSEFVASSTRRRRGP